MYYHIRLHDLINYKSRKSYKHKLKTMYYINYPCVPNYIESPPLQLKVGDY